MSHCDGSPLNCSSSLQSLISKLKCGILFGCPSPSGLRQRVVLWSTHDLGYLTVYAAALLTQNKIPSGVNSIQAGRLGKLECVAAKSFWVLH